MLKLGIMEPSIDFNRKSNKNLFTRQVLHEIIIHVKSTDFFCIKTCICIKKRLFLHEKSELNMKGKEKRLLLIVDPQIDFITGTLPVPEAVPAMDALAEYVTECVDEYSLICVTCDRHPFRHSSFSDFGGQWPSHCVESSVGAAVWPQLMKALEKHSDSVRFLYKGESLDKDEYSIFQSSKGAADMNNFIKVFSIDEIDICGLAGDVCVANTIRDALCLYPDIRFRILTDYTASLDGGAILTSLNKHMSHLS